MPPTNSAARDAVDALVVGAGFAGIIALHRLRSEGYAATLLERGSDVGGTWYWNRYPGARVDIESMEYSYAFSDELQQEWNWSERYASQPEVRRYLEWVVDRLGLRQHMRFGWELTAATWDPSAARWQVEARHGDSARVLVAQHVVLATGFLSTPIYPDIPGIESFVGVLAHTGDWPCEQVEFDSRRVGVIGTAASGVQVVQEAAKVARHVTVFQRTANWCFPLRNRLMDPDYEQFVKSNYTKIRQLELEVRGPGIVLMGDDIVLPLDAKAMDVSPGERESVFERVWSAGGPHMGRTFTDLLFDEQANDELRRFWERKIRSIVHDQTIADDLVPTHRPLTRRPPGQTDYYEAFNRHHVQLVNVKADPIARVEGNAVILDGGRAIELDLLVCATGFDAGTGAAMRIDLRGVGGITLREHWSPSARTHLGMMTTRFPNLYLLNAAQSPAAHFSPPLLADYQMQHVLTLMGHLRDAGADAVEPSEAAQAEWVHHLREVFDRTLIAQTDSWWTGTNVPGKPRGPLNYTGGFVQYCQRAAAALDRFSGYTFRPAERSTSTAPDSRELHGD